MSEPVTIIKTEQTTVTIDGEGIMRYWYNYPNIHEEFEEARVVMDALKKFLRGTRILALVDITNLGFMSPQARALHAGSENAAVCSAAAIIVKTTFARVLSNFYFRTTERMLPQRAFTDEKKALAWLREQKAEMREKALNGSAQNGSA